MQEFYNVINKNYIDLCKSHILNLKVKVILLDHYENEIGEITSKISSTNGDINIKQNQGVRRTCNISIENVNKNLNPDNEFSPLFVNKKFKIYIGLFKENYKPYSDDVIFWFSQGIFITQSCSYNIKTKTLDLSGVDKFGFFTKDLNQHTLQETYKIPAGTKLKTLIPDIITISMGNGMPTDSKPAIINNNLANQELPYDIEKSANETIGDILTEIATAFNADIYYNTEGNLILEPSLVDDYLNMSPIYELNRQQDNSLIESTMSYDYSNIVNQITVMGDNSDGIIYSSTVRNENPKSSCRISNIGIKSADIVETPMGYNEKRCADYANYLLKKEVRIAMSKSISCTPLPHLDCNRIISDGNDDNEENRYLIEEITIPLTLDTYNLSVCNLKELPFTNRTSSIPKNAMSEWIRFKDNLSAVGKYVNRNGDSLVVVPSTINGTAVITIGGRGTLEDDDLVSNSATTKGLSGVTSLYIEDGIIDIYQGAFTNYYYGNSSYNYNDIEIIRFPNTLQTIGYFAFEYAFLDNDVVSIPSNVTINNSAFQYSNIKYLKIGENVNMVDYCFADCYNLTSITIGDDCVIRNNIFSGCCGLEEVIFQGSADIVTTAGLFNGCYNLSAITFPNNLTTIGNNMFNNCTSLTNITIPDGVTSIGSYAFYNCYSLEIITIENPDCEIYDLEYTISNTATIYGYENSTAQIYAEKYNRTFVALEE